MGYETVSIELPLPLFQRLQRIAAYAHRSVEDVVSSTIEVTLPPNPAAPPDLADQLAAMTLWNDQALWAATASAFAPTQQRRLAELTALSDDQALTQVESTELEELLEAYDQAVLRRARALAILTHRGYELPNQVEWSGALGDEPKNS